MNVENGPSPKEMGLEDEENRVQSPELAREMAEAEIGPREKLAAAAELGLSKESIEKLGLEVDQAAEERRAEYEQAMRKAEELLTKLLKNPDSSVDIGVVLNKFDSPDEYNTNKSQSLLTAIRARTQNFDKDGEATAKVFKINGREKIIDWGSVSPASDDLALRFYDKPEA